jgi:hypothetical protein
MKIFKTSQTMMKRMKKKSPLNTGTLPAIHANNKINKINSISNRRPFMSMTVNMWMKTRGRRERLKFTILIARRATLRMIRRRLMGETFKTSSGEDRGCLLDF